MDSPGAFLKTNVGIKNFAMSGNLSLVIPTLDEINSRVARIPYPIENNLLRKTSEKYWYLNKLLRKVQD